MTDHAPSPRRRVRNPDAHRAAILEAALAAFAERGYARATLRDIARRAGVTHGLVQRHFGSKEALFLSAVPTTRHWQAFSEGDPATLPDRIAASFVARMEEGASMDPLTALIRSAASDVEAAKRLYAALHERGTELYRDLLGPEHASVGVDLWGAVLIGVTFKRYVIGKGPIAEMSPDQLTTYLAGCLRHVMSLSHQAPGETP